MISGRMYVIQLLKPTEFVDNIYKRQIAHKNYGFDRAMSVIIRLERY